MGGRTLYLGWYVPSRNEGMDAVLAMKREGK